MAEKALLNEFKNVLKFYSPNWEKIIDTNQYPKDYPDGMYEFKLKSFGKAMKHMRENYEGGSKSYRQFAELVPFSHEYISRIEKNKIRKLNAAKLEQIAIDFNLSVAYLIGLTHEQNYEPGKIDLYFWENPDSKYKEIEAEIREALPDETGKYYMIKPVNRISLDKLKERIAELIGNNHQLAYSIHGLLSCPHKKRQNVIKILEHLNKI